MTFANTLSIATSGLTAAQSRARTVANNIANATTEGYTRRIVVVDERIVGNSGAGVRVAGIQNAAAPYLTADRMRLEANSSYASERATAASKLTGLLGEPGADNGLFRDYTRFETALRDATATPESAILQAELIDRGNALANSFRTIASAADEQRGDADRAIFDAVGDVNNALLRLEEYNALPSGELTPAIADERQRLANRINEYIPVSASYDPNGALKLTTEGGIFLLDVTAQEIDFSPAGNVGRTQILGNPLSGISVNGIDITPGGSGVQQSRSGAISALFYVRDTQVPAFQDQIDGLAADIINRFSDDAVDPTKGAGAPGIFTDGNATPPGLTGVEGVASRIRLNALIDPAQGGATYRLRDGLGATAEGPAGNGDQLNRLLSAFTGPREAPTVLNSAGTRGAAELASEVSSAVSFEDRNASEAALFAGTRFDVARESELAAIGVDTDSELQQLLLIEQAYAANARVIQTVQQMLDELIGII